MASFNDLPNKIIVMMWEFVQEPKDMESFFLMSKTVFNLLKPLLKGHNRLKKKFTTIQIELDGDHTKTYELLRQILLRPRMDLYIRRVEIDNATDVLEPPTISLASYSPGSVADFQNEAYHSCYVPRSERADWVQAAGDGNPDTIAALIIMRLTLLKEVIFVLPCWGRDSYLHRTLVRMIGSAGVSSNTGFPVIGTQLNGSSRVLSTMRWPFLNVTEINIDWDGMQMDTISKLLRNVKELKSFTFRASSDGTFDFGQLRKELRYYSPDSLEILDLRDPEAEERLIGSVTGFSKLKHLAINLAHLVGIEDPPNRNLGRSLPRSLEVLTLYLGETAKPDRLEDLVSQVISSKLTRVPKLEAFYMEALSAFYVSGETFYKFQQALARVGVDFDMGEVNLF